MLTIVKIGGNIIDDRENLINFLSDFSNINEPKILVHGGGKIATDIGLKLGITPNYIDGRRVTDAATLELVTMVYGGLINKQVVAQLQAQGCNAIGLTGADGNIIKSVKRLFVNTDYGYVGDIVSINTTTIKQMLDMGLCPVIAPLTHDCEGQMLNTNADTIAQAIAKALAEVMPVQLIYCFEKNGVLNHDQTVIPRITATDFYLLKSGGIIKDGMIPKLSNACEAVQSGVKRVVIGNATFLKEIIKGNSGTEVV